MISLVIFSVLLSTNSIKRAKPQINWSYTNKFGLCIQSVISLIFLCHKAPSMYKNYLKTHQWASPLHWVQWCGFITTNHSHCSLFWVIPTYNVLLPEILTTALYFMVLVHFLSQQMHHLLLFESCLLKTNVQLCEISEPFFFFKWSCLFVPDLKDFHLQ